MTPALEFIKNILRFHKMKIFLLVLFSSVFSVLLFPFSDLSDKISSLVSENTQNKVYVQFDKMGLTLIPQPALKVSNVIAESPFMPDLSMEHLSFAPSILGLFTFKPFYGRAFIEGLYQGQLDASISSSRKIKAPEALSLDLSYENFNLKELAKSFENNLPLPFQPSGDGLLKLQMDVDPTMKNQPDGEVELVVRKMQIPNFEIPTMMGALALPTFSFEKVTLKGKMKNGKLLLNEILLGTPKDELSAKISGEMDLKVMPGGAANIGFYNLAIDLNMKSSVQNKLGTYFAIIDGFIGRHGRLSDNGKRYAFRIQANGFQDPAPNITSQ